MAFKVAILVVNQSSHGDDQVESTATIVRDVFETRGEGEFRIFDIQAVPLDVDQISLATDKYFHRAEIDVVLVVGGIGVGRRECTPEVRHYCCPE